MKAELVNETPKTTRRPVDISIFEEDLRETLHLAVQNLKKGKQEDIPTQHLHEKLDFAERLTLLDSDLIGIFFVIRYPRFGGITRFV